MNSIVVDKKNTFNWLWFPLIFALGILSVWIPPSWIKDWDNYQFIVLSAVPVFYFVGALFGIFKLPIKTTRTDIAWILFISVGFLSYFWATNGSLIWYQAFGWLTLFLWLLLFRSIPLNDKNQNYLNLFFIALFWLITLPVIWKLLVGRIDWRGDFGYHRNYVGAYVLSLFPFLLFAPFKNLLFRIAQLIGTLVVGYILYYTNSRGAIITMGFIGFYYIWNQAWSQRLKKGLVIGGGLGILGVLIVGFLASNNFKEIQLLKEFGGANEFDRWYMIRNSFWLFMEHPLTGIGFGNWRIEAYKYGVQEFVDFNNPLHFTRYGNHNLYSQHLAELGLVGFLAFFIAIGNPVWYGLQYTRQLSSLQKACFSTLLVYLITSFFYQSPNFFQSYFSGLQLVGFVSLGVLTNSIAKNTTTSWYENSHWHGKVIFSLLSVACLSWFIYAKKTHDLYLKATILVQENRQASIAQIEQIYHPVFKHNHSTNLLLDYRLALLYESQYAYDKASIHYKKALELAPYDENVLLAYSRFLFNKKEAFSEAKTIALKAYTIQENSYATNILLAQIAFREMNPEAANEYLEVFDELIKSTANSSFRKEKRRQHLRSRINDQEHLAGKEKLRLKLLKRNRLDKLKEYYLQQVASLKAQMAAQQKN